MLATIFKFIIIFYLAITFIFNFINFIDTCLCTSKNNFNWYKFLIKTIISAFVFFAYLFVI